MAKGTSGHDGEWSDSDIEHTRERLEEYLGEALENYLLSPQERNRLFGDWVKRIRRSKGRLPDSVGPQKPMSQKGRLPAHAGRQRTMSQATLATRCTLVWWRMFNEVRSWDARWVRKLEAGKVELNQRLVACLMVALRATEYEAAMLLELAGYSGWMALLASRLGTRSTILPDLQDNALPYDPDERAKLLEIRIRVVINEVSRRLTGIPDKDSPDLE